MNNRTSVYFNDECSQEIRDFFRAFDLNTSEEITSNCLVVGKNYQLDLDIDRFLVHADLDRNYLFGTYSTDFTKELIFPEKSIEFNIDNDKYHDGLELQDIKYISDSKLPYDTFALSKSGNQKTLFLDRDGIINVDHSYVHKVEDLEFVPGIFNLLKAASNDGYKLIVVTNQAGVAYEKFSEEDVDIFHKHMNDELKRNEIYIDGWYCCFTHSEKGKGVYKKKSLLRKPLPGMLLKACSDHSINLSNSIMIGDKVSDHLSLLGPTYYHLQSKYDLTNASAKVFQEHSEILKFLFSK